LGKVGRIAPLPDPQSMWMNPDLKVYNSDIYLEGDDPALRTGMSCKVEIIVAQYDDVVFVPIQAVIRVDGRPAVYIVHPDGTVEERVVEIGLDNNSMVRVISGLSEGEVVWLAPPLRAATLQEGSRRNDLDSSDEAEAWQRRINEKLQSANEVWDGDPRPGDGMPGEQPAAGTGPQAPDSQRGQVPTGPAGQGESRQRPQGGQGAPGGPRPGGQQ